MEGLGQRCFDVKVVDARRKSMMLRVEGMGIAFL